MTASRTTIQLFLIAVGLLLILITYFLYPKINQKDLFEENKQANSEQTLKNEKEENIFQRVEYKGFYEINKPFIVKSEKAIILKEEPNVVYMEKMHVALHMNDGRIITITSDKGRYNKETYDCFFEENVKAFDGKTKVTADNLDLVASNNFASIYNNVSLINNEGSLVADKINYDFNKKKYHISMFDKKKVNIKIIQ